MDRCLYGTAPTLQQLKSDYGAKAPSAWLVTQLYDLSEFCGCREKLTPTQIDGIASIINNEYGKMKVSQLMLFFYWFKLGKYGKFYGAVDPLIIMDALKKFEQYIIRDWEIKQDEERKKKYEKWKKEAVTYEEYLKLIGKDGSDPLLRLSEQLSLVPR